MNEARYPEIRGHGVDAFDRRMCWINNHLVERTNDDCGRQGCNGRMKQETEVMSSLEEGGRERKNGKIKASEQEGEAGESVCEVEDDELCNLGVDGV